MVVGSKRIVVYKLVLVVSLALALALAATGYSLGYVRGRRFERDVWQYRMNELEQYFRVETENAWCDRLANTFHALSELEGDLPIAMDKVTP